MMGSRSTTATSTITTTTGRCFRPRYYYTLTTFVLTAAMCLSSAGGARMIAPTDDPTRFGGSTEGGFRDGPGEVARYYHPQVGRVSLPRAHIHSRVKSVSFTRLHSLDTDSKALLATNV